MTRVYVFVGHSRLVHDGSTQVTACILIYGCLSQQYAWSCDPLFWVDSSSHDAFEAYSELCDHVSCNSSLRKVESQTLNLTLLTLLPKRQPERGAAKGAGWRREGKGGHLVLST